MKKMILALCFATASTSLAATKVVKHCEGYRPEYYVDLIKVEDYGRTTYAVDMQGTVKNFTSAKQALAAYNNDCATVMGWE